MSGLASFLTSSVIFISSVASKEDDSLGVGYNNEVESIDFYKFANIA